MGSASVVGCTVVLFTFVDVDKAERVEHLLQDKVISGDAVGLLLGYEVQHENDPPFLQRGGM